MLTWRSSGQLPAAAYLGSLERKIVQNFDCIKLIISSSSFIFASIFALLWALSARVKFSFGYDMDEELNKSMKKAYCLNGWAAAFTALAVLCQAIIMFLENYLRWTN